MKTYTNIEQSKKLAEILPMESADHHYVRKTCDFMGNPVDGKWSQPKYGNPQSSFANYIVQNFTNYEKLPCWSLAALLNYLREIDSFPEIYADKFAVTMNIAHFYHDVENEGRLEHMDSINVKEEGFIDACYEMIIKLHGQKLL